MFTYGKRLILLVGSRILGFGIRNTARGIRNLTLKTGIRNPSSTDKDWNPVPAIWNPQRQIQYPRLCWILLHGARSGIQVGAVLYGKRHELTLA